MVVAGWVAGDEAGEDWVVAVVAVVTGLALVAGVDPLVVVPALAAVKAVVPGAVIDVWVLALVPPVAAVKTVVAEASDPLDWAVSEVAG